jgi:hypothetical protein
MGIGAVRKRCSNFILPRHYKRSDIGACCVTQISKRKLVARNTIKYHRFTHHLLQARVNSKMLASG